MTKKIIYTIIGLLVLVFFFSTGSPFGPTEKEAAVKRLQEASASRNSAEKYYEGAVKRLAGAKIKYYLNYFEAIKIKAVTYSEGEWFENKKEYYRINKDYLKEIKPFYIIPQDLNYVFLREDTHYISRTEREHYADDGLLAIDIATNQKKIPVYAPDYLNEEIDWTIEYVDYPKSTGRTMILTNEELGVRWLIGHIDYIDSKDTKVRTGTLIGYSNGFKNDPSQGISTGPHVHLEFYTESGSGKWFNTIYRIKESNKHILINGKDFEDFTPAKGIDVRVTRYDPTVAQNDADPCNPASGNRYCDFKNGVASNFRDHAQYAAALSRDLLKKFNSKASIEYGDKVWLECDGQKYPLRIWDTMKYDKRKQIDIFRTGANKHLIPNCSYGQLFFDQKVED